MTGRAIIKQDFTKLYAIARRNSKVTARQFERFCRDIGAPIQLASPALCSLFEPRLIEAVFEVQEFAFDSSKLAQWAEQALRDCAVQVRCNTEVTALYRASAGTLEAVLRQVGCVFDLSNNGVINALLERRACSRFTYPVYANSAYEAELIEALANARPVALVYSATFPSYRIDGRDMRERFPQLGAFVLVHYPEERCELGYCVRYRVLE